MTDNSFIKKFFPEIKYTYTENIFSSKRILYFFSSFIQLCALFFLVNKLHIEDETGISQISIQCLIAFCAISFAPLRFRPFLLFITSLVIIYTAFDWFSGSFLIISALFLIACCHFPIKFYLRVFIILVFFTGMMVLRADLFYAPRASLVIPFLASMFMFRIVIYLYDLKYNPNIEASVWQKLSYFFLFPNQCFLLFPVIDFKTAIKTYYSIPSSELWQKGIRWMLRGVIHLLTYRFIYKFILIEPSEVTGLYTMLQYMFASYALIVRLSGIFHFILGLLCMFGFNLHPVFNNYFLATSFVDLWRRINIYWREFVMKIFFYPLIFKIKKVAPKNALAFSMMCMFVITWFLHNYQWFWLRGYFPLKKIDCAFWLIIGACITCNAVWLENRLNKKNAEFNIYWRYVFNTVKAILLISFMSVMWSLWSSNTLSDWLFLVSKATIFTTKEFLLLLIFLLCIIVFGVFLQVFLSTKFIKRLIEIKPQHTLAFTFISILILIVCSLTQIKKHFPAKIYLFVSALSEKYVNQTDKRNSETGYYKKLLDGEDDENKNLWEVNLKFSQNNSPIDKLVIRKEGLLSRVLKPSSEVDMAGYTVKTDSFGLRDKEYSHKRPDNTFRMVLLGGSYEMGAGVSNENIFENIVEEKLNTNKPDSTYKKYEILNFAMYRYHLLHHVELCNTRVFSFQPNAVLYIAHTEEERRFCNIFSDYIRNGTNLKYSFLEDIKRLSGVKQSMSDTEIKERLKPFMKEVITWCYKQIADACKKNSALAIWVFLPTTNDKPNQQEYIELKNLALKANFIPIDLRGVFDNEKLNKIQVSETDPHPNVFGHKLIAEKLYEELIKNRKQIFKSTDKY